MERLIQSDRFPFLWRKATQQEKEQLLEFIKNIDVENVRFWFQGTRILKQELMERARRFRVRNYSRLTKYQLIKELRKYE